MQRIVYISTARQMLANRDLVDILATSRRNNRAAGVTGLLITGGRRFLQTLEGPDQAVHTVFRRIEQDPRHFAIVTLSRTAIERRTFGDWDMGHCDGGATGSADNTAQTIARLLAPIEDRTMRAYFEGFTQMHVTA